MRGQKFCPWWLTLLNPETGDVFDFGIPCDSWTHRACAEPRMERLLTHFGPYLFNDQPRIWVAAGEYDSGLANRMRVRRNKIKKVTGKTVHAFWVHRREGIVYYFATEELVGTGTPESGQWMAPEEAFVVAKGALTLPGIGGPDGGKGINPSAQWRLPPESKRSSGNVRLAQGTPRAEAIAVEAAQRLGCPTPSRKGLGYGWEIPVGVDLKTWKAMVQQVADELSGST
jgi:hypothetical protein